MKIFATIKDIIFRNNENGYTVLSAHVNNKPTTIVGRFPMVYAGLSIECVGNYCTNAKYGEQFAATEVVVSKPNSLPAVEKYLASGLIRGVGEVTARKIVEHFKHDTLDIMEYNPMRLAEIRGISRSKAAEIASSLLKLKDMQQAIIFLQSHNISTNLAIKIFNFYQHNTITQLKQNPYRLVSDIDGVGFLTADKIAQEMGIDKYSEHRIRAGILHLLKTAGEKDGHTYLKLSDLISLCIKLLALDETDDKLIRQGVDYMTISNEVKFFEFKGEEIVMTSKFYYQENFVAQKLANLSQNIFSNEKDYESSIQFYEKINKITLNSEQKQAIFTSLSQGVCVITGGPGTGKTTIIKCLQDILKEENKQVLLLAPTGRASKRLEQSCGSEAKTIHRALEMTPTDDSTKNIFHRNENNPLSADMIIIDEMSMVDITLFYHLLKAVRNTARLVLVGDKDQLSSVGAGNVLRDIINSGKIATTSLINIYRQDENSLIVTNAHLINQGKMPLFDNKSKDFFFISNNSPAECADMIVSLVSERLPSYLNVSSKQIQVLSPLKAGACGVDNLNSLLQQKLNPHTNKLKFYDDFAKFSVGDCVMQTVNNYEMAYTKPNELGADSTGAGVFNGDIGYITKIEPFSFETTVEYDDGKICKYQKTELNQLTLAYAITVHKSQGCEFDAVVIPLMAGAPIIMTRNLIYTALTRAKKTVVLVGTKQNLARMIHNNYTAKRNTILSFEIKENFSKFLL